VGAFLGLLWDADDPAAADEGHAAAARADAGQDWTPIHAGDGVRLWVRGARPPTVCGGPSAIVVGTWLQRGRAVRCGIADLHPHVSARGTAERLSRDTWGAYVALLKEGRTWSLFRDPSGGLECQTWSIGRVRLVTSDSGPPVLGLLPSRGALDWGVIAAWVLDRGLDAGRSGLEGVESVMPGGLLALDGAGREAHATWTPSQHVERDVHRPSADGLVEAVNLAVEGLVAPHERVVNEISGGLDSAIVAAMLVDAGVGPKIAASLNYFGPRPEGDERDYARAVADRCGLDLTCVAKPLAPLTEADFWETARGLRPAFPAIDPVRDRDTALRLEAAGATTLVTGHGGDTVFFQMPTPLVAVDRLQLAGLRALSVESLGEVARFSRKPVWSVLATVAKGLRAQGPGTAIADMAIPPDPWSSAASGAPPAKRLQISSLFRAQWTRGWSRRSAAADVVNPLLAQPVVEFCLATPVPELLAGGRDRGLARRAFSDRLPTRLVNRRSKGDLAAYYGRLVAASLGYLRPLLLDGCLAEAGLLDRQRLDAALTPERLILDRNSGDILATALIEAWVRYWQTQVPDSARAPRPR
jgi:asparagine synthase (glutamine-hydrolysing)